LTPCATRPLCTLTSSSCYSLRLVRSLQPPTPQRSPLLPYTTLFRSQLYPAACLDRPAGSRTGDGGRDRSSGDGGGGPRLLGRCRSEEHTSELQSREKLVCRLPLEKTKAPPNPDPPTAISVGPVRAPA